jgi:hypothetical protein
MLSVLGSVIRGYPQHGLHSIVPILTDSDVHFGFLLARESFERRGKLGLEQALEELAVDLGIIHH